MEALQNALRSPGTEMEKGKKEVDKAILLLCYSNSFQTIGSTCVVRDGEDKDADPSLHSDQLSYLGAS